jgi:hypothetical protein
MDHQLDDVKEQGHCNRQVILSPHNSPLELTGQQRGREERTLGSRALAEP